MIFFFLYLLFTIKNKEEFLYSTLEKVRTARAIKLCQRSYIGDNLWQSI